MDYLNAPECDAIIFRLSNHEELEISHVILEGEDVYHERNTAQLKLAMLEALKEIAK